MNLAARIVEGVRMNGLEFFTVPPGEWLLPRSTSDVRADRDAANTAMRTASTDGQRAACRLRLEDIDVRERAERAQKIEPAQGANEPPLNHE